MSPSVNDLILERLGPIYGVATEQGQDVGSVQELLNRWWTAEGYTSKMTTATLLDRLNLAGAQGSSIQDKMYDFFNRGLLKSALHFDEQYVQFDGTPGNYASTPDSAATSITGDIDIRVKLAADTWASGGFQTAIAKYHVTDNQRSFMVRIGSNGSVVFIVSTNGSNFPEYASPPLNFLDGQIKWIRATRVQGSGLTTVYYSDDGITWTTSGSGTVAPGTAIFDGTAPLEVGGHTAGTNSLFKGKVYYAEIRNGINGAIAAVFSATGISVTGVRSPSAIGSGSMGITSEAWTMNGTNWNYGIYPATTVSMADSVLNSITGDIDIRVKVKPAALAGGVFGLVGKRDGNGGYSFRIGGYGTLDLLWREGGTTKSTSTNAGSIVGAGFRPGDVFWVRGTLDVDNGNGQSESKYYTSLDGITWTQLGTTQVLTGVTYISDNTMPLYLGAETTDGLGRKFIGDIYYAEVRNGIEGPVVAKFDASEVQVSGQQSPTELNGWTLNGAVNPNLDFDYVRLTGAAGGYLSYPYGPVQPTGDLDVKIKLDDDNTSTLAKGIIGKWGITGGNRAWLLRHSASVANRIELILSQNGSSSVGISASADTPAGNKWYRFTYTAGTGFVALFASVDGVTWTPLNTPSASGFTSINSVGSSGLVIGSDLEVAGRELLSKIYYAEVKVSGTVVASFDARDIQTPWTISGSGWNWQGANVPAVPEIAWQTPGTSGNYISTPDAAVLDIAGDVDIRIKCAADNWNTGATQSLVTKYNINANQRSYRMLIGISGQIAANYSSDGVTALSSSTSNPLTDYGFIDGQPRWLRWTLDVDNGAGQKVNTFYYSDDGITWTIIQSNVSAGVVSLFNSNSELAIGSDAVGINRFGGKIFYAEVRNGIDGPIVARFDASAVAKLGTRLPASTVQPGGSPNLLSANDASFETSVSGWAPDSANSTIAQSAAQALDGTQSLAVTSTGAVAAKARLNTQIPVVPGKSYTATAYVRTDTSVSGTRNVRMEINTHTPSGFVANQGPALVAVGSTGWTVVTFTLVIPTGLNIDRVQTLVRFEGLASGEILYVDRISLVETPTVWTVAGSAWEWVESAA